MPDILNDMTLALIVFALAQLADVVTTLGFLRRGGREVNPIIAWLMARLGGRGWIVVKLAVTAAVAWYFWLVGVIWMLWLMGGLTGAVAWHNTKVNR